MKDIYLNAFHRQHNDRLKKHLSKQPKASLADALEQYERIKRGSSRRVHIRVLTSADLHQSRLHFRSLVQVVQKQRPDVVAIVGDALSALELPGKSQFTAAECARMLAELPVEHLLFIRGNHEDNNWSEFVGAWPYQRRKLTALYGASCTIGTRPGQMRWSAFRLAWWWPATITIPQ